MAPRIAGGDTLLAAPLEHLVLHELLDHDASPTYTGQSLRHSPTVGVEQGHSVEQDIAVSEPQAYDETEGRACPIVALTTVARYGNLSKPQFGSIVCNSPSLGGREFDGGISPLSNLSLEGRGIPLQLFLRETVQ